MAYLDSSETQKSDRKYIQKSMKAPVLSKERELHLARLWQNEGDEKALHELVNAYRRLVIKIANQFRFYGLPVSDLIQEGNIGLMTAAEKFEPERDLRFSTYSSWWIKSCVQDYVLRNWSIVRTGTTSAHKSLFFNFRRLRSAIEGRNEEEGLNDSDLQEIADDLGVRLQDVQHMQGRLSGVDSSLNAPLIQDEESGAEWIDQLESQTLTPEMQVMTISDAKTRSEWLDKALSTLPEREQHIITERHLGDEVVTLEALGKELGISKERVRQLEARAMDRLKSSIGAISKEKHADVSDWL